MDSFERGNFSKFSEWLARRLGNASIAVNPDREPAALPDNVVFLRPKLPEQQDNQSQLVKFNANRELMAEFVAAASEDDITVTQQFAEAMSVHLFIRKQKNEGNKILVQDKKHKLKEVVWIIKEKTDK